MREERDLLTDPKSTWVPENKRTAICGFRFPDRPTWVPHHIALSAVYAPPTDIPCAACALILHAEEGEHYQEVPF